MLVRVTIIESLNTDHKNDSKTCLTLKAIFDTYCLFAFALHCCQIKILSTRTCFEHFRIMRHFKHKISNYILNQDISDFDLDNQMKNDSMMQNYVEELNVKLTKKFSLWPWTFDVKHKSQQWILNVNIGGCVIVGKFVPFSNLAPNEQKSKQKLQTSQNSAEFRQGKS